MRKPDPQTHQACRSLLQKAVRRGDVALTRQVALHLHDVGDADWLKTRTAIITFEECWPLGTQLNSATTSDGLLNTLCRVAQTVKVKDATGLGVLAYAYSTGDSSVLSGDTEDRHIQCISEAIGNPQRFWDWASQQCLQEEQRLLFESSLKAYRRGGWPWDRALMQAAAYLAVTNGVPKTRIAARAMEEVPLWVGLDKHTPQGKKALQETAKNVGISPRQLTWVSFYLESARVNEGTESYWWSREIRWRLSRVGLSYDRAQLMWEKTRSVLVHMLREEAEALRLHLDETRGNETPVENNGDPQAQQFRLPGF